MLETILELALSMGIINAVIWIGRVFVCHTNLQRLQRMEEHFYKCLSYSNHLYFHALQKENVEVDKQIEFEKTRHIEKAAIRRTDMNNPMQLLSSLPRVPDLDPFGKELKYKGHSGRISPYSHVMESLHQVSGSFRKKLMDHFEESGQNVDCDFLGWDYETPYPELAEHYQETATLWTYSKMQSKYFDLFHAIQEILKYRLKKLEQLLSFILLLPAANDWFQHHLAPPSREKIYRESSRLKAEHKELRRKTGADKYDHLLRL